MHFATVRNGPKVGPLPSFFRVTNDKPLDAHGNMGHCFGYEKTPILALFLVYGLPLGSSWRN